MERGKGEKGKRGGEKRREAGGGRWQKKQKRN